MSPSPESPAEEETSSPHFPFALQVALLCAVPPVLVGIVAGTSSLLLGALPAFGLIFAIESLRAHGSLQHTGALLLPPTILALTLGVSIRMDPTVPQTALVALPFVPTLAALIGYAILLPLSHWLQPSSSVRRGLILYTVALLLGGALPTWTLATSWMQSADAQRLQASFIEQATVLEETWTTDLGAIKDAEVHRSQLYVWTGSSIVALTPEGESTWTVSLNLPSGGDVLHAGQLDPDSLPEFVVSGRGFASSIHAFDDDGARLWSHPPTQKEAAEAFAPGRAHVADLDGDELDEIVVGSTTGNGLRVVTPSGTSAWSAPSLGVISDIATVDVARAANSPNVLVATGDTIHVYSAEGTPLRTMTPDVNATSLTVAQGSSSSSPILVVSHNGELPTLLALTPDGTERWRGTLPAHEYATPSLATASSQPWLAVNNGNREGNAYVYHLHSGRPLSVSTSDHTVRGLEWMERGTETPQLVGWSERILYGWSIPSGEPPSSR